MEGCGGCGGCGEAVVRLFVGDNANDLLIERYMELQKDIKIKGYLFEQQNYIPKDFNGDAVSSKK